MRHQHGLRSAAAAGLPAIGAAYEGGYFAGLISNTANGSATHMLIVAPAATGATGTGYTIATQLRWASIGISPIINSQSDGLANVLAPGFQLSNNPAALFCSGLSIGGHTDWYLPATYELQIAYENLKPTTALNSADTGNPYSVPIRTIARSASGAPFQTSLAAFQSGGAEAFTVGSHWSSSAVYQAFQNSPQVVVMDAGTIFEVPVASAKQAKTVANVRAFRKIAV